MAREAGVEAFVVVGCDRDSSLAALNAARHHDDVFATVGLHPHEASHGVASITDLLDEPGVVAIGEAGLDYHYDNSPRDLQRSAFEEQRRSLTIATCHWSFTPEAPGTTHSTSLTPLVCLLAQCFTVSLAGLPN